LHRPFSTLPIISLEVNLLWCWVGNNSIRKNWKMALNRYKKILKIVGFYMIGLLCIVCFFFLDNTNIISGLVEKADKFRYYGFPTFLLTGLFKYSLLIVGLGTIIIMSFLLIKEKISESNLKH
jgi:hypothetical protein